MWLLVCRVDDAIDVDRSDSYVLLRPAFFFQKTTTLWWLFWNRKPRWKFFLDVCECKKRFLVRKSSRGQVFLGSISWSRSTFQDKSTKLLSCCSLKKVEILQRWTNAVVSALFWRNCLFSVLWPVVTVLQAVTGIIEGHQIIGEATLKCPLINYDKVIVCN